ncbi:MAG: hypothetical protein ACFFDI_27825 [Promethearchaeota archaeon]
MSLFSSFSKLSGWYRLLVVASILWILFALIEIEPWYRSRGRGNYSHLDEFLLFGILPVVAIWSLLWVIQGFKKNKK